MVKTYLNCISVCYVEFNCAIATTLGFFLMANVRLEGIKRRFNNVTAIEDITFTVPDGQFWV
ncbi:hypothetical protein FM036_47685, partial [Nostoc sp. HG1]|nr:hypothetical protein [Nostoc sp. HG1]